MDRVKNNLTSSFSSPGTCSPVVVVVLLVIYCYMFTIFALDQVDYCVLCIVSQFVFRGLLQLPLWCGLWFIVEGHNGTYRSLNSMVTWSVAVSWTIMPHLLFLYNMNYMQTNLVYLSFSDIELKKTNSITRQK